MIVRISRSRYAPDGETEVFRSIQPLVDGRGRPSGLLDLVVGRRQIEDGLIEQTVITIWDSHAELASGIEPAWDVPPGLDAAVEAAVAGWREAVGVLERRELGTRTRRRAERLVEHRFHLYQVARLDIDGRREGAG